MCELFPAVDWLRALLTFDLGASSANETAAGGGQGESAAEVRVLF